MRASARRLMVYMDIRLPVGAGDRLPARGSPPSPQPQAPSKRLSQSYRSRVSGNPERLDQNHVLDPVARDWAYGRTMVSRIVATPRGL